MISSFYKHVRGSYFSQIEAIKRSHLKKKLETERQLNKYLKELHRDDEKDERRFNASNIPAGTQYNCTKNEGIK